MVLKLMRTSRVVVRGQDFLPWPAMRLIKCALIMSHDDEGRIAKHVYNCMWQNFLTTNNEVL